MESKSVKIDFVTYADETAEQALAKMTDGFGVTARITREVGDAGHPEAEITGEPGEVDSLLMDLGYPVEGEPIY